MTFRRQRQRVYQPEGGEMRTKQEFKDECDIYNVLKQAKRTGRIEHMAAGTPYYDDLPPPLDYQEAMNLILDAQAAFADLPAKLRDKYGNDPASFLEALANPANAAEFREAGILRPLPEPVEPPGDPSGGSAPPASGGAPAGS